MKRARVVVLIPAHNEEASIAATLRAAKAQTRAPDEIIVVCDNCTDRTGAIAWHMGAGLFHTVGNTAKKAGGLNQALASVMPRLQPTDCVLVLDADSIIREDFIANALRHMDAEGYDAVGGVFRGAPGSGMLGMYQRNEYARYARDLARLGGKCLVLTGTATLFRAHVLQSVAAERDTGTVYDEEVLTEDNELTLRLLHAGHRIISAPDCYLVTEVMETWGALAQQRLRWKRGAFENLRQFGLTRITAPYWLRQGAALLGLLVTGIYMASLAATPLLGFHVRPLWLGITAIFCIERAVTVRERGPWMMLVSLALVPEMVYDVYLQAIQARAYCGAALNTGRRW